jgi:hypothetical protein
MVYFLAALAVILLVAVLYLTSRLAAARRTAEDQRALLSEETRAHGSTVANAEYRRGYQEGAESVRRSIRYETEIFECRRSGLIKKDATLRIRERVMLENLQIAATEREVVVSSEVNRDNLWELVQRATSLASVPEAEVVRRIAPGVLEALGSGAKRLRRGKTDQV